MSNKLEGSGTVPAGLLVINTLSRRAPISPEVLLVNVRWVVVVDPTVTRASLMIPSVVLVLPRLKV